MPFPFAVLGPVITGVIGTAAASAAAVGTAAVAAGAFVAANATAIAIGSAVVGGLVITKKIIEENKKAEEEAYENAYRNASREQERLNLEAKKNFDEEVKRTNDEYGDNIPPERKKELLLKSSILKGKIAGTNAGLEARGQSVAPEAKAVEAELDAMRKECGIEE